MRPILAGLAVLLAAWTGPLGPCTCAHAAAPAAPIAKPAGHACCVPTAARPSGRVDAEPPVHDSECLHCQAVTGPLAAPPGAAIGSAEFGSSASAPSHALVVSTAFLDVAAPTPSPPRTLPPAPVQRRTRLASICLLRI
jgi:hypothetical protein